VVDLTGQLLLATPSLLDPNFHRAVILLLDHGDHGAMGIILNRPLEVRVDAVLPTWQPHVTEPAVLFQGGPVGLDSALGLVALPGDLPEPGGVRRIDGSLALVDLDTEPETVVGQLSGIRVFAGYAGWGTDQLEREIREGSWYVVPAEPRDPFTAEPALLWRQVLRRQPGELSYLASFPEDPSLN
jgi:putative transcriptional regulator